MNGYKERSGKEDSSFWVVSHFLSSSYQTLISQALLEFWDPVRMIFKFTNCDLTPTIEEISDFIDLPHHELQMMVPYKPSSSEFLKSIGMKSNPTWTSLDLGWTHLDFLYSRFDWDDDYYIYGYEFECSIEEWESIVWMPLPSPYWDPWFFLKQGEESIHIKGTWFRDLAQRGGEPRKTIVPMILVEIMRSLSACVDGRIFFEGCNLLL